MAKSLQKIEARRLRREEGLSIKEIAEKVGAGKSTVSLWCRDIELTPQQIRRLEEKEKNGRLRGRLKGARVQKERRLKRIRKIHKQAKKDIKKLSKENLFLIGVALYWAEGHKKQHLLGFASSDPKMILFFIKWLQEICKIPKSRLKCLVGINQIHKKRIEEVEKYWSKLTGIPRSQFTKPSFKKVKTKKIYKNIKHHYGTFVIRVSKSTDLNHRVKGWIEALKEAG